MPEMEKIAASFRLMAFAKFRRDEVLPLPFFFLFGKRKAAYPVSLSRQLLSPIPALKSLNTSPTQPKSLDLPLLETRFLNLKNRSTWTRANTSKSNG